FAFVGDVAERVQKALASENPLQVALVAKDIGGRVRRETVVLELPTKLARREPKKVNEFYCDEVRLENDGRLSIKGWALSDIGVENVQILFEGEPLGFAECGQLRPDVGNQFPTVLDSRQAGFKFDKKIDPSRLAREHVIVLEALLRDGARQQKEVSVVV